MDKRLDIRDLVTTETDRAEAAALQQEALESPTVRTQAQSRYERYREEAATQAAELTGVSRQDALARIPAYSAAEVERKTVRLPADHPLQIKGEWMTFADLVARGAEFDGVSIPDPIEGAVYGKSTAKVYYNSGNLVIHSWAHGVGISYVKAAGDPPSAPGAAIVPSTRSETVSASEPPATGVDLAASQPVESFPHRKGSGDQQRLLATHQNYLHLLDAYKCTVRYNVIAKEIEINIPGMKGSLDNRLSSALTHIESLAALNGLSTAPCSKYVTLIADEYQYNPIADWIHSKPWDGQDRLSDVYATLVAHEDFPADLKQTLLYRWLISAVAAVLKPSGFHCRGVLTLQGEQSLGKTSWIRNLVSEPYLQDSYVLEGHHLDPANKDTVLIAIKHWIVELGELDSSFKKDIARIKGFITNKSDTVRKPYAAAASEFQRRTVFAASVNEEHFLVDPTGNSRWWVIPLVKIYYDHEIDMQQVFAQLAVDYTAGEQWWLTRDEEELLQSQNRWFEAVSVIEEQLVAAFDHDMPDEARPTLTASEALQHVDYTKPTNAQARECGGVLRKLFGQPKKIKGRTVWRLPLRTGR